MCCELYKHFNFIRSLVYYLATSCSQSCWCGYPCPCEVKKLNHHLNSSQKFTEDSEKTYTIIFDTLISVIYFCYKGKND